MSGVVATGEIAGAGAGFDTSATTATNGEGGIGVFLGVCRARANFARMAVVFFSSTRLQARRVVIATVLLTCNSSPHLRRHHLACVRRVGFISKRF